MIGMAATTATSSSSSSKSQQSGTTATSTGSNGSSSFLNDLFTTNGGGLDADALRAFQNRTQH